MPLEHSPRLTRSRSRDNIHQHEGNATSQTSIHRSQEQLPMIEDVTDETTNVVTTNQITTVSTTPPLSSTPPSTTTMSTVSQGQVQEQAVTPLSPATDDITRLSSSSSLIIPSVETLRGTQSQRPHVSLSSTIPPNVTQSSMNAQNTIYPSLLNASSPPYPQYPPVYQLPTMYPSNQVHPLTSYQLHYQNISPPNNYLPYNPMHNYAYQNWLPQPFANQQPYPPHFVHQPQPYPNLQPSISNQLHPPNQSDSTQTSNPLNQQYANVQPANPLHSQINSTPHLSQINPPTTSNQTISGATNSGHQFPIPQQLPETPKILQPLPEFDGNIDDWQYFYSQFVESTQKYHYSNLENTSRLNTALKGKALKDVKCFLSNPQNVNHVIRNLEFIYGRPELLLESALKKIKDLPTITENNAHAIITMSIEIQQIVCIFEQMPNSSQHLNNPIVLRDIVNKLPMSRREEWIRFSFSLGKCVDLTDLCNWINQQASFIRLITTHDQYETSNQTETWSSKQKNKCFVCNLDHQRWASSF